MSFSPPLNHQVMPKYSLFLLLLCLAIYASMRCLTPRRGVNTTSHFSAYDALNKSKPACDAPRYSTCLLNDTGDNSNLTQTISFGGSLISEGGTFKLGFFVLGRDNNTYLGISYKGTNPEAIVWVANRESPIPSQQQRNCSLVVGQDGIARLLDSNNHSYWSTNSKKSSSARNGLNFLQLSDTGNLILKDRSTREALWQSFEHPTDTILQDQSAQYFDTSVNLTSWEAPDNPAQGSYAFQRANFTDYNVSITRINSPSLPYWRGSLSDLPTDLTSFLEGTANANKSSLRLVLSPDGIIQLWQLDDNGDNWSILWAAPTDQCDVLDGCGSFGVCDAGNGFMCKCLPGFVPVVYASQSTETNHFTGDCTERTSDACGDEFLRLSMIKVPPNPESVFNAKIEQDCRDECHKDCRCKAYSFDPRDSNCKLWTKDLYNIQEEYYHQDSLNLSIRVSNSDIDFGESACGICGTNVIPYPLSSNSSCGDPNYSHFQCNSSNGQVYLRPTLGGNLYKVSHINEAAMMFVVQLPQQGGGTSKCDTTNNIESKLFSFSNSSPFSVTNCSIVHLLGRPLVEEVEITWNLPPPPPCLISSDCDYWPNTSCYQDLKVCKCAEGFHSHLVFLNCTKVDDHKGMSLWVKVGVASICGILLLLGAIFVFLRLQKRKATQRPGITEIKTDNDIEDIDIPFVDYESILYATDNFSEENKLGVGGFGPVYKGKLVDGNAVAIKRLSAASAQGAEEFRNEVILIAKLQHRNLVRVLGYCAKENEKILIYEYMPNKSLDAFLFDHTISTLLDWIKRFNIIMGIARGLLYLHQDSRLIIIHRDLKPSNILLDEELNPKISDFGLARIVAGNELAASTARIIGTHGYMSPEYALDGYFSIKSDVYSFGIIILEIISGRRCASLLQYDNNLISLLGYAWFLWDKGDPMELVDESVESYDSSEVKRCINVGLLCVQEDPSDRPTMSNVLLMLSGDNMNLPYPKQPVFVARRPPSETASSSSKFGMSDSNVELTTTLEGR